MADIIPKAAQKSMNHACEVMAKKIGKTVKKLTDEGEVKKAVEKSCKEQIKSLDKKAVTFFVEQLEKALEKKNGSPTGAQIKRKTGVKWNPKPPGAGVPSLTIPITQFVLDKKHDIKGKFSVKVWADPREFEKKDKGVMVNFSLVNW